MKEAAEARSWYAQQHQVAGEAFDGEWNRALDLIAEHPDRWAPFTAGTRRYLMRRFPFAIVYRVSGDLIEIIAVAHLRRRPGYWRGR